MDWLAGPVPIQVTPADKHANLDVPRTAAPLGPALARQGPVRCGNPPRFRRADEAHRPVSSRGLERQVGADRRRRANPRGRQCLATASWCYNSRPKSVQPDDKMKGPGMKSDIRSGHVLCFAPAREQVLESGGHALRDEGRGERSNHALRYAQGRATERMAFTKLFLTGSS